MALADSEAQGNNLETKKSDILSLVFVAAAALLTVILMLLAAKNYKLSKELDKYKNAPADTVTVVMHDTVKIAEPVPVYKYIKVKEYVAIHDTLQIIGTDTLIKIIELPREYLVYKDTSYRAVVSGVQPRLDSIEIYQKTITNTITKTVEIKKRPVFSISVGPGVSWDGKKVKPSLQATAGFVIKSW